MSINRGMDKEDVVHIYKGILLHHKKERNCVICRDVDGPRVCHTSEVSQKEKNKYHILTYICGIKKNGKDDLTCKVEIRDTNIWIPRVKGGGMNWEIRIDIYTLLCIKQMTNENLLCSTGNSTWCSVVT